MKLRIRGFRPHALGAAVLAALLATLLGAPFGAQAQPQAALPADQAADAALKPVRGVVQSVSPEEPGKRIYIRLKLDVLKDHARFPIITYRVPDQRLIEGLKAGDRVAFKARQVDGEPTLVAIERS